LPQELKRVQDGVLHRLPVSEFDTLVERATRTLARKVSPRLLEARYHAVLKEEALVGDGQWKVRHQGPTPGLLNLEPFSLALRHARFENGEAIIAAFDGKTPALLVETAGEQTVSLDWSARAESGPEGLQFRLEVPTCPVAVLELDVPVGRLVTLLGASDDSLLLSGPHPAEKADVRRWKIVWRGRDNIHFRIGGADRPTQGADQPSTPFVVRKTTQKLHPEGLDATFELTLSGLPRGVRELVCECDPVLRLREVVGPHVDGCSFQVGAENKPSRLTIRLSEPVRGGTWQIVCLAPLTSAPPTGPSSSITWRSPALWLVGGVPRGETLILWLHPDLRVESWDPGSFRLTSMSKPDTARPAGAQNLTLMGGGLGTEGKAGNTPRRPQVRLQTHGVEFRARQLSWWRCDAAGMALTAQIGWEVSQGQLFQLPVLLPTGWSVERVEMSPARLLRNSRVRSAGGRSTLYVDLTEPLGPRTSGAERPGEAAVPRGRVPTLTVHLRPEKAGPVTPRTIPLPDPVPLGARFREGALALNCDEQLFHLEVQTTAERSEPDSEGPWDQRLPEHYYRYRGQALTGKLSVRPRAPRLRAKCSSEIFVASGMAAVKTHLLLEAEVGSPETVDVAMSGGDSEPWQWVSEPAAHGEDSSGGTHLRRAERLYPVEAAENLRVLGAGHPLQAALLLAARPSGQRWRLTFTRPLRARESIRLQATRKLQPRDNRWQVPLPVVLGPGRMEGEVTLHLAGGELVQVHTVGLTEAASPNVKSAAPWRTFRYGQANVALSLSGQTRAADRAAVAVIDRALLVTYADGRNLQHHFSFQVANWSSHTLPVRLPPGSRPLAVQVDGHWLPRLVPAAPTASEDEADELALPVPGGEQTQPTGSIHRYEIVYARTVPVWLPWQTLEAPAPVLPVSPLAFRRIWRLPPNLTPLDDKRCRVVPGTLDDADPPPLPGRVSGLFHLPGIGRAIEPLLNDTRTGARESLASAVEKLRGSRANEEAALRDVVSDLAFTYFKDRYPLVIDTVALGDAGITVDTRLRIKPPSIEDSTPPWEECGLVAVPARSAVLLTTATGRGAALREPLSDSLEQALAAASAEAQDPSGRFQSALTWLRPSSSAATTLPPNLPGLGSDRGDWGEWEPVAGLVGDRLIVVRRGLVTGIGYGLTVGLALFFWLIRRRRVRTRLTLLILVMAVAGLGTLWLPSPLRDLAWYPLLGVGLGALLWYFKAAVRGTSGAKRSRLASRSSAAGAATAGIFLLGVLGWGGRAAPTEPVTVYLVPGPPEAPENQTVLVPADLLERLKALTRPSPLVAGGPRAVLLDASYDGRLAENKEEAEFAAVFSVHCLSEEPSILTIPLNGLHLSGEVWLDGAHADPLTLTAPQTGYALKVRGRGRHKVELRFRAPVVGTAEDRNVLFTVPSLLRSRLIWHAPAGGSDTQVLVKQGAQWVVRDGGGERLEADLGRLPPAEQGALPRPVHLHWYQPAQPGRPPRVRYQAAYLWDLCAEAQSNLEASYLTAWLRYQVIEGAVKTLQVDLPADLEVRSAAVRRTGTPSKPSPAWLTYFRLRDWYVTAAGNKRTLHLEFPYSISGDFQLTLELVPRTPLPSAVTLALPSPRGERSPELHYLAYRTQRGLNAVRDTPQNITRIPEAEFAPDWLGVPRLDARSTGAAYKISPDQRPVLRLHLSRSPPTVQADLDVSVQAGAQMAEVQVDAVLEAPNGDLAAVEWDLGSPRLTIVTVTGQDVRTWKQSDRRVLVWLNQTTKKTRIRLSGWLPLERRGGKGHLELPGPRLVHAPRQHTKLRLAAAADLALTSVTPVNLQQVAPLPPVRPVDDRERTFQTLREDANYSVRCEVQPAGNAVARVLTLAEVNDRQLQFTTTVDYEIRHGELRDVSVRLKNWEHADKIELHAEREALRRGPGRTSGPLSWQITLQRGVTKHYRLTLRGNMPIAEAAVGVLMPEVTVQGVESAEYVLAVAGNELTGEARSGLLPKPAQTLAMWPGAAERVERTHGQAWHVQGPEWQLRLLPHARAMESAPVRVFLLEQSAAVRDGRRWLHEARFWLRHEAHTDLNIDFPAPARVVAASVDGVEVTPLQPGSARLWLPLPGRAGVRCVSLRWLYDEAEPLEHPNLAPPEVVDALTGPTLWTVRVPAGWDVVRGAPAIRLGSGATREAALALYRAEAQLRICQDLGRQGGEDAASAPLAAAQHRFALYCRHARHALDLGANRSGVTGPDGKVSLGEWLDRLQSENPGLADQNGFDAVRADAERRAVTGKPIQPRTDNVDEEIQSLPQGGTLISWQGRDGTEPPVVQLASHESQQTRQALAASGQWLGLLMVVWILSFVPFLLPRLRLFWPEQIALLGLVGWHLAGWTLIVLLLLFAAVIARLFLLVRGLRSIVRRRKNPPSTMTARSGVVS
jgi:hypothetical protein